MCPVNQTPARLRGSNSEEGEKEIHTKRENQTRDERASWRKGRKRGNNLINPEQRFDS